MLRLHGDRSKIPPVISVRARYRLCEVSVCLHFTWANWQHLGSVSRCVMQITLRVAQFATRQICVPTRRSINRRRVLWWWSIRSDQNFQTIQCLFAGMLFLSFLSVTLRCHNLAIQSVSKKRFAHCLCSRFDSEAFFGPWIGPPSQQQGPQLVAERSHTWVKVLQHT